MVRSKFDRLRREKAYRENRDISLRTVAAETGLSLSTVQRLKKGDMERVYLSTLDTLCAYFGVRDIGDVIEYVPGTAEAAGNGTPPARGRRPQGAEPTEAEIEAADARLEACTVSLGHPTGLDNARIDADLAHEYADHHADRAGTAGPV